jgi:hypothetical protein
VNANARSPGTFSSDLIPGSRRSGVSIEAFDGQSIDGPAGPDAST